MSRKTKITIFWISLICVLALSVLAIFTLPKKGAKVVITQGGKEYGTYDLTENQTIKVENEYGTNIIEIRDSTVKVIKADCPNQICVMSPPISADMLFPIVCLPHELIIEIQE